MSLPTTADRDMVAVKSVNTVGQGQAFGALGLGTSTEMSLHSGPVVIQGPPGGPAYGTRVVEHVSKKREGSSGAGAGGQRDRWVTKPPRKFRERAGGPVRSANGGPSGADAPMGPFLNEEDEPE
jgi:hypothetical protein